METDRRESGSCCGGGSCCSPDSQSSCPAAKPLPLPGWGRAALGLGLVAAALSLALLGILAAGQDCGPTRTLFAPLVSLPVDTMARLEAIAADSRTLLLMIPAVCLLGAACSVASCCNIAIMGALGSYAGVRGPRRQRDAAVAALSLAAGSVLTFGLVGAVLAVPGRFFVGRFSLYGRTLTGLLLILFGLFAWNLLPLDRLSVFNWRKLRTSAGVLGAAMFGLTLGGASMTCSLTCVSPALPVALGVATLLPSGPGSIVVMLAFGLGYSVPLTAVLIGAGYGTWTLCQSRFIPWVRRAAGATMFGLGFYFLL